MTPLIANSSFSVLTWTISKSCSLASDSSQCSSCCSGIHYIDQAGLELTLYLFLWILLFVFMVTSKPKSDGIICLLRFHWYALSSKVSVASPQNITWSMFCFRESHMAQTGPMKAVWLQEMESYSTNIHDILVYPIGVLGPYVIPRPRVTWRWRHNNGSRVRPVPSFSLAGYTFFRNLGAPKGTHLQTIVAFFPPPTSLSQV